MSNNDLFPSSGLETVEKCPACGSQSHNVLYSELGDLTYFTSADKWTLRTCNDCHSAFLSPRPNHDNLYLVYKSYYTHTNPQIRKRAGLRSLADLIDKSYANLRFSSAPTMKDILVGGLLFLWPQRRRSVGNAMRNIPRHRTSYALLDVGCGNGEFLEKTKSFGWKVVGLDADEGALKAAADRGIEVYQKYVDEFETSDQFNVITLNQVIEHVPDPAAALRACFRLLKPGGYVWIDTPNLDSVGHEYYGKDWRGLEIPRHLVIFPSHSLKQLLVNIGFVEINNLPYQPSCLGMFLGSADILLRRVGGERDSIVRKAHVEAAKAEKISRKCVDRREFVSLIARKPALQ